MTRCAGVQVHRELSEAEIDACLARAYRRLLRLGERIERAEQVAGRGDEAPATDRGAEGRADA